MSVRIDPLGVAAAAAAAALVGCTYWQASRFETTPVAARTAVIAAVMLALVFVWPLLGQFVRRRAVRVAALVLGLGSWLLLAHFFRGTPEAWSNATLLYGERFVTLYRALMGLCLVVHLLMSVRLAVRLVSQYRLRPGHCPTCGYDLRATPERCPE